MIAGFLLDEDEVLQRANLHLPRSLYTFSNEARYVDEVERSHRPLPQYLGTTPLSGNLYSIAVDRHTLPRESLLLVFAGEPRDSVQSVNMRKRFPQETAKKSKMTRPPTTQVRAARQAQSGVPQHRKPAEIRG